MNVIELKEPNYNKGDGKMTVKELKELLANVDDELEIVGYVNGMEQNGLLPVSGYGMRVMTGKIVKKETWDRLDGTDYTYEAFEENKDGDTKVFRLY